MNRSNFLRLGEATAVADELKGNGLVDLTDPSDLKSALINALYKIAKLEEITKSLADRLDAL